MARERIFMRVDRGAIVPADDYARGVLRDRGFSVGDLVSVDITKPRSPRFHRFIHQIGIIVADNIEAFKGVGAHEVIKRIQLEANIKCEQKMVELDGVGQCAIRVPQSISFAKMDEGEFRELARSLCRHISEVYWPDCTPEQIAEMADVMIDE